MTLRISYEQSSWVRGENTSLLQGMGHGQPQLLADALTVQGVLTRVPQGKIHDSIYVEGVPGLGQWV